MPNNIFNLSIAPAWLVFAAVLIFPPTARAMTLAEAVAYAMEHNRDVLSVREQIVLR